MKNDAMATTFRLAYRIAHLDNIAGDKIRTSMAVRLVAISAALTQMEQEGYMQPGR